MQKKKAVQLYQIPLEFANGVTRTVKVRAKDRETAERRALKFNPTADRVKRNA